MCPKGGLLDPRVMLCFQVLPGRCIMLHSYLHGMGFKLSTFLSIFVIVCLVLVLIVAVLMGVGWVLAHRNLDFRLLFVPGARGRNQVLFLCTPST